MMVLSKKTMDLKILKEDVKFMDTLIRVKNRKIIGKYQLLVR